MPFIIQRSALGVNPPYQFIEEVGKTMTMFKPKGLDYIHTGCGCGSGAIENALKAAFIKYMKFNEKYTLEDKLNTVLDNKHPGSTDLAILSFKNGFHGRTLGCLSTTRTNPFYKIDIPAFNWPAAPFPKLKYPLEKNIEYNKQNEESCINSTIDIIKNNKIPIAAMIVEPIQSEGGDNHASSYFFNKIREIAQENDITFIVDEVQTGVGSTGHMWAHEAWNLKNAPDIVVFAKKMQIAGYFYKKEFKPENKLHIFNTWLGDPLRIFLTNKIGEVIEDYNLLDNVKNTGQYLKNCLESLNSEYISNIRGVGTFISFDVLGDNQKFVDIARKNKLNLGTCSQNSVRLRPSLTLTNNEVDIFMDRLTKTINAC